MLTNTVAAKVVVGLMVMVCLGYYNYHHAYSNLYNYRSDTSTALPADSVLSKADVSHDTTAYTKFPNNVVEDFHSTKADTVRSNSGKLLDLARRIYYKYKFDTSPKWMDKYTLKKNLLRYSAGPKKGEPIPAISNLGFYDFDPRMTWSVYLHHFLSTATDDYEDDGEQVQFSWYDWTDFHEVNNMLAASVSSLPCNFVLESAFDREYIEMIEEENGEPLFSYDRKKYSQASWYKMERKKADFHRRNKISDYCEPFNIGKHFGVNSSTLAGVDLTQDVFSRMQPPFYIKKPWDNLRPEVFQLQARIYMWSTLQPPLSITILDGMNNSFQIPINQTSRLNLAQNGMLQNFVNNRTEEKIEQMKKAKWQQDPNDIDVEFDHIELFEKFVNDDRIQKYKVKIPGTNKHALQHDEFIELKEEDFDFDVKSKISELEELEREGMATKQDSMYLDSLKFSLNTPAVLQPKYFAEARGVLQYNGLGHHRDRRFFYGDNLIHDTHEYALRLNSMIRTFQKFAIANGLVSWLSHGTLYGYMYNGMTFPWDNDFDLQMPIRHLHLLAQYFNQSLVLEDPREGNGRYMIDVGSSLVTRSHGNGHGNIDARVIDIDTGMYIDLTGLSVSYSRISDKLKLQIGHMISDQNITVEPKEEPITDLESLKQIPLGLMTPLQLHNYSTAFKEQFSKAELRTLKENAEREIKDSKGNGWAPRKLNPAQRLEFNKLMKAYNCKNDHFSLLSELSPLRNTLFHSVPALIPNRYVDLLRHEYRVPAQYEFTVFQQNAFIPEFRSWLTYNAIRKYANIHHWYANLKSIIKSLPPNIVKQFLGLSLSDVKTMYANMVKSHDDDLLALQFASFDLTSYRVKKLGILYSKLTPILKTKLLRELRRNVAPHISSPGKDAFMFNYERKLWKNVTESMDPTEVRIIEEWVMLDIYDNIVTRTDDLMNEKYYLFNISEPVKNIDRSIFAAINPQNTTSTVLDFNKIGTNFFTSKDKSWSLRSDNMLFRTDVNLVPGLFLVGATSQS